MGNQKICHKNGIPSDRFYYNILGHVFTAEFPHKNQCPLWNMGRPLETASNGQCLALKLVPSDQLKISYFFTCHKCTQLLENEVNFPSGSFQALPGHWFAVLCCLESLGRRGCVGSRGLLENNTCKRKSEEAGQGRGAIRLPCRPHRVQSSPAGAPKQSLPVGGVPPALGGNG